jgi:AraC family transcriptional regulator
MAYVRWRRLVWAARRLRQRPAPALAELAFDCGFESQQAFTRAFKRVLGLTPGRFRRLAVIPLPSSGETLMSQAAVLVAETSARLEQLDGLKRRPAFRVAGLLGRFDADTRPAIPGLWGQFVPRLPLAGQVGWETYGVCFGPDVEKGFEYMAAVEIAPDAPAPEGLQVRQVPAQAYAVFRLTTTGAELHPQMAAALMQIWGEGLQAAGLEPTGGPDLEVYPADFDQRRPGDAVEFWIPVKG